MVLSIGVKETLYVEATFGDFLSNIARRLEEFPELRWAGCGPWKATAAPYNRDRLTLRGRGSHNEARSPSTTPVQISEALFYRSVNWEKDR